MVLPALLMGTGACLPDLDGPTVVGTSPADGAVLTPGLATVDVTFDEAVDPTSAKLAFSLAEDGAGAVAGRVSVADTRLVFTPAAALKGGTIYRITVSRGCTDLAGNRMAADFYAQFATGSDLLPYQVLFVSPTNLQAGIGLTNDIVIAFSRAMDPKSVRENVSLSPQMDGQFLWNAATNVLVFRPIGHYAPSTYYTCSLGPETRDATGVALGATVKLGFTTGTNFQRPQVLGAFQDGLFSLPVSSRYLTNGGWMDDRTAPIVIDFDQPMDAAATEGALAFSPAVSGWSTWRTEPEGSTNHHQLVFHPATPWALGTMYELSVGTGAKGANGLVLAAEYRVRFAMDTNLFARVTNVARSNVAWAAGNTVNLTTLAADKLWLSIAFATAGNAAMDVASVQVNLSIKRLFGTGDAAKGGQFLGFDWSGGGTRLDVELGSLGRSNTYLLTVKGGADGAKDVNTNPLRDDVEVLFRAP